jgi:hypothetical protein
MLSSPASSDFENSAITSWLACDWRNYRQLRQLQLLLCNAGAAGCSCLLRKRAPIGPERGTSFGMMGTTSRRCSTLKLQRVCTHDSGYLRRADATPARSRPTRGRELGVRAVGRLPSACHEKQMLRWVLRSRNNNDFNARHPAVVRALRSLPDETVVDGEIVELDAPGRPSFSLLQTHGSENQIGSNLLCTWQRSK